MQILGSRGGGSLPRFGLTLEIRIFVTYAEGYGAKGSRVKVP